MKITTLKQMEHEISEIERFLSYAELSTCGDVVILSGKDFRRIEKHVKKAQRLLPSLGNWAS